MNNLKTIKEASEIFGVTTQTIRSWLKGKGIHTEYEKVIGIKPRIVVDIEHIKRSLEIKKFNSSIHSSMLELDLAIDNFVNVFLKDDRDIEFIKEQVETIAHNYFVGKFNI